MRVCLPDCMVFDGSAGRFPVDEGVPKSKAAHERVSKLALRHDSRQKLKSRKQQKGPARPQVKFSRPTERAFNVFPSTKIYTIQNVHSAE